MPATPILTVSFAPITFPEAFVPAIVNSEKAELAAAEARRKLRREREDMRHLWVMGRELQAGQCPDYSTGDDESKASEWRRIGQPEEVRSLPVEGG